MIAKFTRGTDHRLGIRFEPETFEEQLLLEIFTRYEKNYEFRFLSWEQNHAGRVMREGLTSVWGELVEQAAQLKETKSEVTSDRFTRPVVCAWCGNRHRSAVPFDTQRQGSGCAASVFQVTEEFQARARAAQESKRSSQVLESLARTTTLPLGTWLVQGYYGSTSYDCGVYRFVKNLPTAPADPICDNCIGERLLAGDLERNAGESPTDHGHRLAFAVVANGGPYQIIDPPHRVEGCETIAEPIYIVRARDLRRAVERAEVP